MARGKKKQDFRLLAILAIVFAAGALLLFGYLWWQNRQATAIRYREFGIPIPEGFSVHGIDVSRYQQTINWPLVKQMQVQGVRVHFAFIKATEGSSSVDAQFKRNWKHAKEAGITRGAYHFFIASRDGTSQAKHFLKTVSLQPGDLPPVVDIEQTNGVQKPLLQQRLKAWLQLVESVHGIKPIIYTNADFYKSYLADAFDDYPFWVAHYLQPTAPRARRNWHFWQHSERGRVNGIRAMVDFNVFNGDSTRFAELLLK